MTSAIPRRLCRYLFLILVLPATLFAQYQQSPPDFGESYSFPTPAHPEPVSDWLRLLDAGLLAAALGLAAWLILKRRNRTEVALLSIACIAYFGFYRKGCICSVGAIQNVVLCLVDPHYVMSFSAIAIFFLPLAATLLFGRVFCGGVCPLGAIQDFVVLRPVQVPVRLDKILRSLQYVYLGLAVLLAGWGLKLQLGAWNIDIAQRFIICDWDPFIPIFRRSGPFSMIAVAAIFILAGMFIGRPYCRWLCPYGGILALLSRIAWKNVSITPDTELDCGKCAGSCPYGAIQELRADRATCMACARCYASCPRHKRLIALKYGPQKLKAGTASPRPLAALARTWTGIAAILVVAASTILLLATYIHARSVVPAGKALVESLVVEARMDAEVQKVLQPEMDRQHKADVVRRAIYSQGSSALIIAASILMAWFTWFRPENGTGRGAPAAVLHLLEKPARRKN